MARQFGIVREIDCDDADEFLNVLSLRGEIAGGAETVGSRGETWLFRGHADDRYILTPSALRDKNSFSMFGGAPCVNNDAQVRNEISTLERFFNLANVTGLPLPEDSQALRSTIQHLRSAEYFADLEKGEAMWPPPLLWSLLAMGQHYGIPTRLLDWSRKSLPAAYFAAEGAAAKLSEAESKRDRLLRNSELPPAEADELAYLQAESAIMLENNLSVWVFNYRKFVSRFDKEVAAFFHEPVPPDVPIAKVTAPHAQNPNLHAQDGLFTLELQNFKKKLNTPVNRTPLNSLVENFLRKHKKLYKRGDDVFFYRVRLKWKNANELFWRLAQEGVNHATIYPGYKSVVTAMQQENWHA